MSEDDKAIFKMIALYLGRAKDAIDQLSPDGAHELAIIISDNELSPIGDMQTLITELLKRSKH